MKFTLFACLLWTSSVAAADLREIQAALANRVEQSRKATGIVVGIIDAHGRNILARGDSGAALDGDTVFEIGSVTKVFTSLLLAGMVEHNEVKLDDPVTKFLPPGVTLATRGGRQITLLDLAMQVSGLPRLPDNFKPADPANPYADYRAPQLYDFLSRYKLARDIGEKYEYSNLGAGLLAHALSRRAGCTYQELLQRRILGPLGMRDTSIVLSSGQRERLAAGHNSSLVPVKNWDFDVLEGAGALHSTANDLLKFVAANLGLVETPLRPAMQRMRSVRRAAGSPDLDIMLGWHVLSRFGVDLVWHNGATSGYRAFVGFDPAAKRGVVVLSNTDLAPDDLGLHILEPRYALANFTPAGERNSVVLEPDVLARYTGEYEFAPGVTFKITLDGSRLLAQAAGQPSIELFAERAGEFFLKDAEARVSFSDDALILHQNGRDTRARRIKK